MESVNNLEQVSQLHPKKGPRPPLVVAWIPRPCYSIIHLIDELSTCTRVQVGYPFALFVEPTHKLDVLGHYCPVPVSQARKALADLIQGDVLMVIADDPETMHDMPILVDRLGHQLVDVLKSAGEFRFIIEVRN